MEGQQIGKQYGHTHTIPTAELKVLGHGSRIQQTPEGGQRKCFIVSGSAKGRELD